MLKRTFEKLKALDLEYSDFEAIEEILAGCMIYDHDEMIIDILKLNKQIMNKTVYKLILNHMMGNCENGSVVAISYSIDKLMNWKNNLLVEPYSDDDGRNMVGGKLNKVFKKGSELEYFNNEAPCFRESSILDGTIFKELVPEDLDLDTLGLNFIK